MAFVDTVQVPATTATTPGWQALMAELDLARIAPITLKPISAAVNERVHRLQQMLIAGALAASIIIAVAGALMLRFP